MMTRGDVLIGALGLLAQLDVARRRIPIARDAGRAVMSIGE